jgi:hypothetical protein
MSNFLRAGPLGKALLPAAMLAASLHAQTVTTVISNGTTDTRYDIVILGDGYQLNEQTKFNNDCQAFLTSLFQKEPYQTFAAYYNVHTVFRASQDSGADRPDEQPPVYVNTVYDATYNYGGVDRCLYIQNTSQALADAALAPATEGRVLVMVNDTRYGGCASTFAVSYTGSQMSEVQAHELGHSLGQLADEYEYAGQTYTGSEPSQPNITADPAGMKWQIWHGTQGISSFQGAGYHQYGLYRPRNNCLMRSLGQVLCRVCQENITLVTNSIVDVVTSTTPDNGVTQQVIVPAQQTFSITHFVPAGNNPIVEWLVDGVVQPGANATSFTLDSSQLSLGAHTVSATVLDQSDRVRSDPQNVMLEQVDWNVQISDPSLAQLRFASMNASATLLQPGDAVTYTPSVANDGPAAAGPFRVEFFLSQNAAGYTPQDTYLGHVDFAGLPANQQTSMPFSTKLPYSLPLYASWVHAVIDRTDVVGESNEADNETNRVVFVQQIPCTTGLEFQDPLTQPFAASLSLSSGGTLHPTVLAPCADPAVTLYLIAWGGSGTAPGTALSPTVQLPLNLDPLTNLTLAGLNGPVFGQFLGVLDGEGRAQATFTLPPSAAIPTGTTHFATVLLGATELFTAASNPVLLTIQP